MDDTQYELNKSDFGGGITDNAEYSDGGTGTWESPIGRTSNYEVVDMDAPNGQKRTESYKVIRTGEDEMAFFLNDDVDQPIEQGVLVKRGGILAWEKTIEPTAELLMETWIGMMSGTDATGYVWIPLDGKRSNGSRTGLISSKE